MSVPPVTSSLQVLVSQLDSAQVPDALTSGSIATVSSSGHVLPASFTVRDSEQITASEALLVHQEGPRASEYSLLAETIPETQDIPHCRLWMSLSLQMYHRITRSSCHVKLRRPTLDHTPA